MLERERDEGEEKQPFSDDFKRFFQSELGRLYAMRATRRYRNHKISPRSKVQVFMKIKKRRCPKK